MNETSLGSYKKRKEEAFLTLSVTYETKTTTAEVTATEAETQGTDSSRATNIEDDADETGASETGSNTRAQPASTRTLSEIPGETADSGMGRPNENENYGGADSGRSSGLTGGGIAGAVVGSLAGLGLILVAARIIRRRRQGEEKPIGLRDGEMGDGGGKRFELEQPPTSPRESSIHERQQPWATDPHQAELPGDPVIDTTPAELGGGYEEKLETRFELDAPPVVLGFEKRVAMG